MIRGSEAISTVLLDIKHMFLESAKNATIPVPSDVADKVKHQRKLVYRVLPNLSEDVHYAIDHLLLTNVIHQWSQVRQNSQWFCHENAIKRVRRTLNHKYVVLPVGKNSGGMVVVCKRLYYSKVVETYGNRKQFEPLLTENTVDQATDWANQRLYESAVRADLHQHWVMSKRARIPSSIFFSKIKAKSGTRSGRHVYFFHTVPTPCDATAPPWAEG